MNLRHLLHSLLWIGFLAGSVCSAAPAAPTRDPDSTRPVHIEADRLEADQKQGHARYSGHVHVRQGTFELFADTLDVHTQANTLTRLVARGKPARFKKFDHIQKRWITGQGRTITYTAQPQKQLHLKGSARIEREGGETLSGESITYHITTETIQAQGAGKQRVHVILPPQDGEGKQ